MAVYQRPGVYVEETLNPIAPVVGANAISTAAFIGTAKKGPVVPTLVGSWTQFVTKFGGWDAAGTNELALAVHSFFVNGGSAAYIYRVVPEDAVLATLELLDDVPNENPALIINALNPGAWGNDLNVAISNNSDSTYNVIVYYGGDTASYIVERFADVSSNSADRRYVASIINGNSNYITIDTVSGVAPAATASPEPFASGADGTAVTAADITGAVAGFDVVSDSLILNAPGITSADVNDLIDYAEARQDIFVVLDPVAGTVGDQLDANDTYTASSYAAVYYPQISVVDPTKSNGATIYVSPAGAVIGLIATTDTSRGVFKAPAGLTARLSGAVSVAKLTNAELDSLNSAPVPANAIKFVPGSGIVVMGSRTLKAGYVDRYVPVRRTLIYLHKYLTDITQYAIFEPNDEVLWRSIEDRVSGFLTNFWSEGGLRGAVPSDAFFVKCDSENNTTATIDAGEVRIEVGVALQRPAEFVIIKLGQYDGGTSVTIA